MGRRQRLHQPLVAAGGLHAECRDVRCCPPWGHAVLRPLRPFSCSRPIPGSGNMAAGRHTHRVEQAEHDNATPTARAAVRAPGVGACVRLGRTQDMRDRVDCPQPRLPAIPERPCAPWLCGCVCVCVGVCGCVGCVLVVPAGAPSAASRLLSTYAVTPS